MSRCVLHGHRPSDKSRSKWARRKTRARRKQQRLKLTAAREVTT